MRSDPEGLIKKIASSRSLTESTLGPEWLCSANPKAPSPAVPSLDWLHIILQMLDIRDQDSLVPSFERHAFQQRRRAPRSLLHIGANDGELACLAIEADLADSVAAVEFSSVAELAARVNIKTSAKIGSAVLWNRSQSSEYLDSENWSVLAQSSKYDMIVICPNQHSSFKVGNIVRLLQELDSHYSREGIILMQIPDCSEVRRQIEACVTLQNR